MQCISYCTSVSDHNSLRKSLFILGKCSTNDKQPIDFFLSKSASTKGILIADFAAEETLLFHILLLLLALLMWLSNYKGLAEVPQKPLVAGDCVHGD